MEDLVMKISRAAAEYLARMGKRPTRVLLYVGWKGDVGVPMPVGDDRGIVTICGLIPVTDVTLAAGEVLVA